MDRLELMQTFVAVVEAGSFTAAAKQRGMTNKQVSKHIAAIENSLQTTLLHRTTRSQSLTDVGRTYLEGCRKVLAEIEALDFQMDPADGLSGTLKISTPLTFGETSVMKTALRFMDAYPDITLQLEMSDAYVDLAEGGYDLAIRMGTLKDSSLIARKLGHTEFHVVATPDYVDTYGTPEHPADLANHNCIRDTNQPDPGRWPFYIEGQLVRIPVTGTYVANSPPACLAPVFAGKGIYHCAAVFLEQARTSGKLVRLLDGFRSLSMDISAVYLPSKYRNPKVTAFVDMLHRDMNP